MFEPTTRARSVSFLKKAQPRLTVAPSYRRPDCLKIVCDRRLHLRRPYFLHGDPLSLAIEFSIEFSIQSEVRRIFNVSLKDNCIDCFSWNVTIIIKKKIKISITFQITLTILRSYKMNYVRHNFKIISKQENNRYTTI